MTVLGISTIDDYGQTWTTTFKVSTTDGRVSLSDADPGTQYLFSLYWAFTTMVR